MTGPIESPHGEVRFGSALAWLVAQPTERPLLVLAPSLDAANDLVRAATREKGAVFGWALESMATLAARLTAVPLSRARLTLAPALALEAVCVRVVAELDARRSLGRLTKIADRPGLPAALLRTFSELGLAGLDAAQIGGELGEAYAHYRATLAALRLADRATMFETAIAEVRSASTPPIGLPLCLYDLPVKTRLERDFLSALAERAPSTFLTFPCNDSGAKSVAHLASALSASAIPEPSAPPALQRLQAQLFSSLEVPGQADDSVSIFSAPGESREAVEIVRSVLREAARGTPFDRMAVLLRSPFHYRTHLLEALRRAAVPAHFTREALRPDPAGRAFLVLLDCAAEGLSATRFSEYLSLGVLPDAPADFSVPRRWEALLVDAAVIGGAERWHRRLEGLTRQLQAQSAEREVEALRLLSSFALPIIDLLATLPRSATWGTWLDALTRLAERSISEPASIVSVLGELAIVREVGPIDLKDVLAVLRERLGEVAGPPRVRPSGALLVAAVEEARGRVFDVVFVPGLAEKLFPQRVVEDPLLPDQQRAAISADLETQARRVASERTALALAVGAARRRVVLSYPRFETDKARPRVPSFYALEAIRAAEGRLPGFAELARRADETSLTRMGWPAPEHGADAIDAAEYDLASLRQFLTGGGKEADGALHYLLGASPRLRRALQFRARRWRPEWRHVDGLVDPNGLGREALDARRQTLHERGFAVTALEKYAACPYRFYLSTVVGLRPRKTVTAVEELDAPTRGLLIHEMLQAAGSELHERGLFSATSELHAAKQVVERAVEAQAEKWREQLAPAIPEVWHTAIDEIRADLATWLYAVRDSAWQPVEFERSFGIGGTAAPVTLAFGLPLRGAIDVIEQSGNTLRATDYKTGMPPVSDQVVGGGRFLQPLFYSLVLEQLYPGQAIGGGNAYYCTSRAEFHRTPPVELTDETRAAAAQVAETIRGALEQGFFPAMPAEGACEHCDFRRLCGPHEPERVARKERTRLEPLLKLRDML